MLFAVGDTVWNALIAGAVTLVLAYFQWRMKESIDKAAKENKAASKQAADKVESVKETLETSTASTDKQLNSIHTLVNSDRTALLKVIMLSSRRIAEMTSNKDDRAAADMAKKVYEEHETTQAKIDAKK